MRPPSTAHALAAIAAAAVVTLTSTAAAQPAPPQIVIGATVAERLEAARALVPLLKDVRGHAEPGVAISPGTVPNSPFTGTQTTLFAFTFTKRSVAVDPRVVAAMNRLLDWNIASDNAENAALFDKWLIELEARSSGAMRLSGGGLCDVNCVVKRMTTLDETWGSSPRDRAETRDELLLEALRVAVLEK